MWSSAQRQLAEQTVVTAISSVPYTTVAIVDEDDYDDEGGYIGAFEYIIVSDNLDEVHDELQQMVNKHNAISTTDSLVIYNQPQTHAVSEFFSAQTTDNITWGEIIRKNCLILLVLLLVPALNLSGMIIGPHGDAHRRVVYARASEPHAAAAHADFVGKPVSHHSRRHHRSAAGMDSDVPSIRVRFSHRYTIQVSEHRTRIISQERCCSIPQFSLIDFFYLSGAQHALGTYPGLGQPSSPHSSITQNKITSSNMIIRKFMEPTPFQSVALH